MLGPMPRMTARSRTEKHRTSTPLELFFDLCFVVAVAQAGGRLVHAVAEGHPGTGIAGYLAVFFGDLVGLDELLLVRLRVRHRRHAVPPGHVRPDHRCAHLRRRGAARLRRRGLDARRHRLCGDAARAHQPVAAGGPLFRGRGTQGRAAVRRRDRLWPNWAGSACCSCPPTWPAPVPRSSWCSPSCELSVPAIAERDRGTSWHPHHIGERYGLFTIIVLGETIAAATVAVQESVDEHDALGELLPVAAGGLLIVFAALVDLLRRADPRPISVAAGSRSSGDTATT